MFSFQILHNLVLRAQVVYQIIIFGLNLFVIKYIQEETTKVFPDSFLAI